jgi:tRNA 2-thiouridine synthesizing protein A
MTDRPAAPGRAAELTVHTEWDAGPLGCGELVLELRVRMLALGAGERLRLIASDPGAPEDLPAWCRMTGHRLLSADHPQYIIERRGRP